MPNHQADDPAMPAGFGLATATFVVVASMVGVGILTTSGYTVAATGSNALMLGLWAVGGVVALCGALTIAELAAALPKTGGDYVFLREAFGAPVAFLSGWVSFFIGFAGPIAASASASASYLTAPFGLTEPTGWWVRHALATASILAFTLIHVGGRRGTARVQVAITLIKVGGLTLLAIAGIFAGRGNLANLNDLPTIRPSTVQSMLFSLVYIAYGYTGWNAAGYLAGEIGDPKRRLPLSILIGTVGVTALYMALNLFYALALPASEIRRVVDSQGFGAVAPIAELAATRLFDPRVAGPLSVAVGLMLWSTLSAYVLTGPRVLHAMAVDGLFPSFAARLTRGSRTPALATFLQSGWALLLLWSAPFDEILIYASVGLSLFSMLTVGSVYALRIRRPDLERPFRVPGYPLTPAIFLLVTGALIVAAFNDPNGKGLHSAWFAIGSVAAGLPAYYGWKAWSGPQTSPPS
ncbi:amino acid permease [Isosphaeraceae bacterium EP7]